MSIARRHALAGALGLASGLIFFVVGARIYLKAWRGGWLTGDVFLPLVIYTRTVITPNYFDLGFVRRGLGGTIASLLGEDFVFSGMRFDLVALVFLGSALGYLVYRIARSSSIGRAGYLALALAISPQAFIGWSRDPVRTDVLVAGFVAWALIAMINRRPVVAVIVLLIGSLAHETAIIYGAPLLAALICTDYFSGNRDLRTPILTFGVLGLGLIAIAVGQRLFAPSPAVLAEYMLSHSPSPTEEFYKVAREIAVYMAAAGSQGVRTAICWNLDYNPQYYLTGACAVAAACLYVFVFRLLDKPLIFALATIVPLIFMLLVANDTGRWLKLSVLNAWLLTAAFQIRSPETGSIRLRHMAAGGAVLVMLILSGSTRYYAVNNLTNVTSLRLGVSPAGTLENWMAKCDPQWRTVVYGSAAKARVPPPAIVPAPE